MASTDAVKRALRRLAERSDSARPPYRTVVDEGVASLENLARAAAFAESVGRDGLSEAVRAAEAADDEATARRAREALAAFDAFRRAARAKPTDAPSPSGLSPAHTTHKSGDRL